MKAVAASLAGGLILGLLRIDGACAQTGPAEANQRTVEVTGHADANAKPDAMVLSFAVDTQGPTADECTKAHAEKVVQDAIDNGATRFNQVQFTLRDDSGARKEAIEKASTGAKAKTESGTKSMGVGVGLGKVIHISTNAQVHPQIVYGNSFQMAQSLHHAQVASAAAVPVLPHEVGLSADVTVIYEIE
ncbi:MAG TPA: SIMPL domain-containing protein [Candidatus Binataceae bacterium]|nr:SIMPL domain-containing protein [Candidatus Binataceae bacterium]